MVSIAAIMQRDTYKREESQVNYESMRWSSLEQNVLSQMDTLKRKDKNAADTDAFAALQALSQDYNSFQAMCDSRAKKLGKNIEGLDSLIKENITKDSKLNFLG